jgi:hypothetical protein
LRRHTDGHSLQAEVIAMLRTLSVGAALVALLAACATGPHAPPGAAAQSAKQMPPPGCVATTGSTLPARSTSCAGPGSTYSSDDLQRTGATTVPDALRRLDPDLIVTH